MLLPLLLEDELAAGDAIAALRRYSLIGPPVRGVVSVHRLVQAVTLDQMPGELRDAWRQAAAALIEAAIPDDAWHTANQPATWPVFAALLPHAQAALAMDSDGMERIALYLGLGGSYAAARDLARGVHEARVRALGPEHPDTLAARHTLAYWTGEAGDAAAARDQFAALLAIRERYPARGTRGPWPPGTTWPIGPGRREIRRGPGTSSLRCCPSASRSDDFHRWYPGLSRTLDP